MKQIFFAGLIAASLATPALAQIAPSSTTTTRSTQAPPPALREQGAGIAAVVNGQVITYGDITARTRLLALSSGQPLSPDVMARMAPQITKQLIDQTLQLQEINKRNIVVADTDVVAALAHIEQGNNLPPGGLRAKMEAAGVPYATLVAQIRTELGWQQVLHQVLGPGLTPTPGDLAAEKTALKSEIGSTQYHIAEIFIPVTDPQDDATARNFANIVITQLRAGAPFPIMAAQFSQNQTALQGGDRGFVQLDQLDPAVAQIVQSMPAGAISNPIRVPGGYDIVQLIASQNLGNATQTVLDVRQAFAPYPLITNGQVGPAQTAVIQKLMATVQNAHSCPDMEAANATLGNTRPSNPGPVNLSTVTPPQFQALLASLAIGQVSRPLVAQDGVSVIMVCGKQSQAAGLPPDDTISQAIVSRRVDLESEQLMDDLRHRSIITQNIASN